MARSLRDELLRAGLVTSEQAARADRGGRSLAKPAGSKADRRTAGGRAAKRATNRRPPGCIEATSSGSGAVRAPGPCLPRPRSMSPEPRSGGTGQAAQPRDPADPRHRDGEDRGGDRYPVSFCPRRSGQAALRERGSAPPARGRGACDRRLPWPPSSRAASGRGAVCVSCGRRCSCSSRAVTTERTGWRRATKGTRFPTSCGGEDRIQRSRVREPPLRRALVATRSTLWRTSSLAPFRCGRERVSSSSSGGTAP